MSLINVFDGAGNGDHHLEEKSIREETAGPGSESALRRETGETVLDGLKLLEEAVGCGAAVTGVLLGEGMELPRRLSDGLAPGAEVLRAPGELVSYASPVMNSPGPVFSVRLPRREAPERPELALVLEDVQDPGNVGTVIRTANAFGFDAVLLTGSCADPPLAADCARQHGRGLPPVRAGADAGGAGRAAEDLGAARSSGRPWAGGPGTYARCRTAGRRWP